MLRVMLYQQWKTVRLPLFLLTILVFAVPGGELDQVMHRVHPP